MAVETKKIDWSAKKSSTSVALPKDFFAADVKESAVHQNVLSILAGRRAGTAKVKTRGEVAGGGRKPYRQKGTGNARHGSNTSPIFAGGGTVFGPKPRSYAQKISKKLKKAALNSVLTDKLNNEQVFVCTRFSEEKPSTKKVSAWMKTAQLDSVVFVDKSNETLSLSVRNIPTARYLDVRSLNVFDLLKYKTLVISEDAVAYLNEGAKA